MENITVQVNSNEVFDDYLKTLGVSDEIAGINVFNVVTEKVSADLHEKVEAVIKCALLRAGVYIGDPKLIAQNGLWQVKDGYKHLTYNGERIISISQVPEMTTNEDHIITATINWY